MNTLQLSVIYSSSLQWFKSTVLKCRSMLACCCAFLSFAQCWFEVTSHTHRAYKASNLTCFIVRLGDWVMASLWPWVDFFIHKSIIAWVFHECFQLEDGCPEEEVRFCYCQTTKSANGGVWCRQIYVTWLLITFPFPDIGQHLFPFTTVS